MANRLSFSIIATRQYGFIVRHVWEIIVRKSLTIFEGCNFPRFFILIWLSFQEIDTRNFKSDPWFFDLVNCIHIVGSQTIAAIILGFQSFFWKTLPKDNRRSLRFLTYEHRKKHFKDPLKSRYWNLFKQQLILSCTCIL